jgi:hypothetical protein
MRIDSQHCSYSGLLLSNLSRILGTCSTLGILAASTLLPLFHDALYHWPAHAHQHVHADGHSHAHPPANGLSNPHHHQAHDSAECQLCQSSLLAVSTEAAPAQAAHLATEFPFRSVCLHRLELILQLARGPPSAALPSPYLTPLTLVA